jgi:hypothetical protein
MDSCLCPNFVPDRFEPHPHHRVEAFELSVPHVEVFQVEVLW